MLADSPDHRRGLSLRGRVFGSRDSLEPGELLPGADHLAGQVRLAQVRRAADHIPGLGRELARQLFRELHDPLRTVVDRSQLLVPDDLLQLLDLAFEPGLAVVLPVEAGILEPGAEHRLVPAPDGVLAFALAVSDGDEMGQERSAVSLDGEVALMGAHGRDHDGGRKLEIALVEVTEDRVRPLDQVRDLLHQLGIGERLPSLAGGGLVHERHHPFSSLRHHRKDVVLAQGSRVAVRALYLEPPGGERPVSAGALPRLDGEGLEGNHLSVP